MNKVFLLTYIQVTNLIHDRSEINLIILHSHIEKPRNYLHLTISQSFDNFSIIRRNLYIITLQILFKLLVKTRKGDFHNWYIKTPKPTWL